MKDINFLLKSTKELLIFFGAAIPAFAAISSLDIHIIWRNFFFLLASLSFVAVLLLLSKVYKLAELKTRELEIDEVFFLNDVGDVNNFYTNTISEGTRYFDQVITSGHIINSKNDAYVKCLQNGGSGTRIILITSLHDVLTVKRSAIHAHANIILVSDKNKPLSQLSLPSITLTDKHLLITFSDTSSSIKGRPILLESNASESSRGIHIKFSSEDKRKIVESYFEYVKKTSEFLNIKANDVEHVKHLLFKDNPHKYKLDVVSAIAKDVLSICEAKADKNGGSSDFLKYIGVIGSYAKCCINYYNKSKVANCNEIDMLCIFTESLSGNLLNKIYGKIDKILTECTIDNEICFSLEKRIAPIKISPKTKEHVVIHLICVPESSLAEGSCFSQFDRLTNHFDLWPYINDSQSLLNTLYNVKSSDLSLPKLKDDKLGPKSLLKMIQNKSINGTNFNPDGKKLDPLPGNEVSIDELEKFSLYAVKWSLLNYIRCFKSAYI